MMTEEFNRWWDADELTKNNPFEEDTRAFWAWEGWQAAVAAERERRVALQAMLRTVGKWGFRGRSVAEEYDMQYGAGSWRRAIKE